MCATQWLCYGNERSNWKKVQCVSQNTDQLSQQTLVKVLVFSEPRKKKNSRNIILATWRKRLCWHGIGLQSLTAKGFKASKFQSVGASCWNVGGRVGSATREREVVESGFGYNRTLAFNSMPILMSFVLPSGVVLFWFPESWSPAIRTRGMVVSDDYSLVLLLLLLLLLLLSFIDSDVAVYNPRRPYLHRDTPTLRRFIRRSFTFT